MGTLERLATWDKSPLHEDEWVQMAMGGFNDISWKDQASDVEALETRATSSDGCSLASDDNGAGDACQGKVGIEVERTRPPLGQSEAKAPVLWTDVGFEGDWRCASICNGTLTWKEGEHIEITVTSRTSFRMTYVGKVYEAWLLDDGKLQWDDGDVWTRGPVSCCDAKFDCDWGCASIGNGMLVWKEGEEVAITVISCRHFKMTYAGKDYEAWLLEDGKLQWDDGDVWVRRGKEASESIDRTWKAVNTAEAEVTALDPRAKQHLRFPCDQRHKQNTVPARQTASSQRHGVASASVWRPSELRRHSSQPKDGPVLARSKGQLRMCHPTLLSSLAARHRTKATSSISGAHTVGCTLLMFRRNSEVLMFFFISMTAVMASGLGRATQ